MKKQRLIIESIRYIVGTQKSIKLKGKTKEIYAYQEVLNASKKLYESLHAKNASLQKIEKLVDEKKHAAIRFEDLTGQAWPL